MLPPSKYFKTTDTSIEAMIGFMSLAHRLMSKKLSLLCKQEYSPPSSGD